MTDEEKQILQSKADQARKERYEKSGTGIRVFNIVFTTVFACLIPCALIVGLYKLRSVWPSRFLLRVIALLALLLYAWIVATLHSGLEKLFKKK